LNPAHPFNRELTGLLELEMLQGSKVETVLEAIKELMD